MNPDSDNLPPKLAQNFLCWFLRDELAEEVQGDLEEQYDTMLNRSSPFKAKMNYWYQVCNYLRPFAVKKIISYQNNQYTMFQNYFKVGWRNLTKQKMYSAINIGGLSMSVAACLLIALFIWHELSYDKHYPDGDRIYRIVGEYNLKDGTVKNTYFPGVMASVIEEDFQEVETAGHFIGNELLGRGNQMVRRADDTQNIYEEGFVYADQGLLNILQPHFVSGDPTQALTEPNTLVISKSKADKYFPDEDPLGKMLILNDNEAQPYVIRGVFEDFPTTSHFQYDFLLTVTGTESFTGDHTTWRRSIFQTYIKVQPGTNVTRLATDLTDGIVKTHMVANWVESGLINAEELGNQVFIELQPIRDIHLRSAGIQDGLSHGDIRFVWLFGAVAGFILIIACINFINLSTAKSANRAKEVGLRKVVGSFRIHLIQQFLTESVLFSMMAFVLALLLAWVLLPYFNELAAKSLVFPWNEWWFLPGMVAIAVLVGIAAGLYPSFYLSRFQPIQVLKGGLSQGSKSSKLRSGLVIFQFTTSTILIIGTFIIYQQLNFILSKDVGFDKEQVLMIQGTNILGEQIHTFKNELRELTDVESVTASDYLPIAGAKRNGHGLWKKGRKEVDSPVGGQIWSVDEDYIQTMGMKLLEGRNFNMEMASDSQAVIINRTLAKELDLDDPVGQEIIGWDTWHVIGMVEDFHYESLTENIKPLCFMFGKRPWEAQASVISVKVNTTNMSEAIEEVSSVWERFSPNEKFRYTFLDESFARMYADVQRMGRIFSTFAVLAIVIACLGLFALSAFMVEQRKKEVSIRLVLGASLNSIFRLLTQNFLILILISLVIAIPVAWYMMGQWLADYEYRIQIGWEVFLLAGLLAIMIALLTISYQSIRAALMNPTKNLRGQ